VTDGDHPAFPLLVPDDTPGLGGVIGALEATDAVDGLGTDTAATLAWAVDVARPASVAATWELLASVAARDVAVARVLEPHLDADGFLAVRAELFINGELIGYDLVSNMGWPFPELVAYAARNSVVVPGDVLGSGTVGNGGCLGELWGRRGALDPRPLEPGDEVRLVIEGVGEVVNVVGPRVAAPPVARARTRSRAR